MGSNFNLGSIPEDMSMDTDLDTTLTAETSTGGQTANTLVAGTATMGNINNAAANGNTSTANKMDSTDQLISTVLPVHAEIPSLGDDNDIMLNDMNDILNQRPENEPVTHWL